uniref:Uncharacterized protein n=1 Tax=Cucumis melo TaxID=3656 RepID=A0A9I9E6L5_CUCME
VLNPKCSLGFDTLLPHTTLNFHKAKSPQVELKYDEEEYDEARQSSITINLL